MRTIARILSSISLAAAAAACNSPSTGDQSRLEFTPVDCGNPLLGCDLDSGLAAGAAIGIEVRGLGGVSTDGLTLVSATPTVLEITNIPDGAVPTWSLRGLAAGTATVSALDAGGVEVDTLSFGVAAPDRLSLTKVAGMATGPTNETGVDEAWSVPAGALVSFQVRPWKDDYALIGSARYQLTVPLGSTLLDTEQSSSDPTNGYLYVQPAAGDYTFTFSSGDLARSLDVALHAR